MSFVDGLIVRNSWVGHVLPFPCVRYLEKQERGGGVFCVQTDAVICIANFDLEVATLFQFVE